MKDPVIERAVHIALLDVLPGVVERLRDDLVEALGRNLPRRNFGAAASVDGRWAAHEAAIMQPLPVAPETGASTRPVVAAPAPAAPQRDTSKHGQRLSPELVAEIWRLHDAGLSPPRIAAQTGATRSSVAYRLAMPRPAAPPAAPAPAARPSVVVPELDVAAFRAAWADGSLRRRDAAERCGLSVAEAEAAARRLGLPPKALDHAAFQGHARPLEAVPATGLEPVPASHDDAADWLTGALTRERLSPAEIEQRLAVLTPAGVLAECNTRRRRLGLPPYRIARRAA